jgi:hypothetical protein
MIKQILQFCDYSFFAEAALVMFLAIFILVTLRTLAGSSEDSSRCARIALSEQPEGSNHE